MAQQVGSTGGNRGAAGTVTVSPSPAPARGPGPLPPPPPPPGAGGGPGKGSGPAEPVPVIPPPAPPVALAPDFELASNDPLVGLLLSAGGAVDLRALELDSPALGALRKAGVVLTVPLISSGSLVGLINLGPRLSERDYSSEDRRLLNALAGYAAPALRVGQLVRQQEAEARNLERIEQELKIAQIIQQQFLPKAVPDLPNWHVAAFYRQART